LLQLNKLKWPVVHNSAVTPQNNSALPLYWKKGKGKGLKVKVKASTCYSTSYHCSKVLCNLGSGSWLAWANDTAEHYAAIHCPR